MYLFFHIFLFASLSTAPCTNTYYNYDGSCNNVANPDRGKSGYVFYKGPEGLEIGDVPVTLTPANQSYALFSGRPNERIVSKYIINTHVVTPNSRNLNLISVLFGQMIVHDLSKVDRPTDQRSNVAITEDDDIFLFNFDGTPKSGITAANKVISVRRSGGRQVDGHFEPHNENSGWLDLSVIYGSNTAQNNAVRGPKVDGKIWLPDYYQDLARFSLPPFTETAFLPTLTQTGLPVDVANIGQNFSQVFSAGDSGVAENIVITTLHVLFAREHNRLAGLIKTAHPTWTDEEIFQKARIFNIALYQHIVYDEYLDTVWGEDNVRNYVGNYNQYNPNIDGSTGLTWTTAAMRVGHSNVKTTVNMFDGCGNPRSDWGLNGTLPNAGTGSGVVPTTPGELLALARGWSNIVQASIWEKAEEGDVFIVDALANILIASPVATGIDVVSSNIRRGRIHSTPNYHTLRQYYYPAGSSKQIYGSCSCTANETSPGPDPLACWLKFVDSTTTATAMRTIYGKINNVDAYTGLLVETHNSASNFGFTSTAIVLDQFKRSRDGDRFFWEGLPNSVLSGNDKSEIRQTSLSDLIKRHTSVVTIHGNAFKIPNGPNPSQCPH